MNNPFPYSDGNKRYHTFNYYLKHKYHGKVAKVILDNGFTCPNRDGTKGTGGCIFCSLNGSGDSNSSLRLSLKEQYANNKAVMDRKWDNKYYIPYFQSFSNTYGPLSKIKDMVEPFLQMDEVAEISLATRCDCLEEDVVEYLAKAAMIKPIWIELGLQTSNDTTGQILNRGYDFAEFKQAVERLSKTPISICVHIINGLPYEDEEIMLKTVRDIAHLPIQAIKIHMLHIIRNTRLAELYEAEPFYILEKDEYIDIVVKQLKLLKKEVVIERLTGDPIKEDLITPHWLTNKTIILNDIDKLMAKENICQGDDYAD